LLAHDNIADQSFAIAVPLISFSLLALQTFCPALYQCGHADNCNYGVCWPEIDAFFDCDADEADSCPGLCEDYDVKSSFVTA